MTIGGFSGALQDRTWTQVDRELEKSQAERGSSSLTTTSTAAPPAAKVPHAAGTVGPTAKAAGTEPAYSLSELVLHNDDEHGYWISVDGAVYDVTEFLRRHPGGPAVLQGYSGRDATQAYHRLHSTSTAAAVALRRCRKGLLDTPGALVSGHAGRSATCDPRSAGRVFHTWANLLGLVVEMQNALRQDFGLLRGIGQSRLPENPRSPYLIERSVDTFERFVTQYLRPLGDAVVDEVWPIVVAAAGWQQARPGFRMSMERLWSSAAATATLALPDFLRDRLAAAVAGTAVSGPDLAGTTVAGTTVAGTTVSGTAVAGTAGTGPAGVDAEQHRADFRRTDATCERLAGSCMAFLGDLKNLLREGILILEHAQAGATTDLSGMIDMGTCAALTTIAEQIPTLIAGWLEQAAAPSP